MKTNKLLTRVVASLAAVALCATVLAGCKDPNACTDGGPHQYVWEVDKEATCVAEGQRTGVCPMCGDVKVETLPIDPDAHKYGAWQITAPTEEKTGTAVKTCEYDSSHKTTVTLPVFDPYGAKGEYDKVDVIKPVSAAADGDGELRLTLLANDADIVDDIVFNVTVPRREVTDLKTAAEYAASLGSHIRTSEGYYTESKEGNLGATGGHAGIHIPFDVYFGNDYVKVTDFGPRTQSWYSLDENGDIFGVYTDATFDDDGNFIAASSNALRDEGAALGNMDGFGYQPGNGRMRLYGAEGLLLNAIQLYSSGTAVIREEDNEFSTYQTSSVGTTIAFSFSIYENPTFARYRIEATLYPTGEIKTLTQTTTTFQSYMIAEDEQGNKLFKDNGDIIFAEQYEVDSNGNIEYEFDENGHVVYDTDEDGNYIYAIDPSTGETLIGLNGQPVRRIKGNSTGRYYSDDHEDVDQRTIVFENQSLKTEDDVVPDNLYPSDLRFITDFDVYTPDGDRIGEEAVSLPSKQPIALSISNVQPTTADLTYDPLELYVREPLEGGGTRDILLTIDPVDNIWGITGFHNRGENFVTVSSPYAGDFQLVIKTLGGKFEKVIDIHFTKAAPSQEYPLLAEYNRYTESGSQVKYIWTECSTTAPVTVYANQPFTFRGTTNGEGIDFIDTSFTVDEDVYLIAGTTYNTVGKDVVSWTTNEDGSVTMTATKEGRYLISIASALDSRQVEEIYIDVAAQPSVSEMFINGTVYEGEFNAIKTSGNSGNPVPAEVKVTVDNSASGTFTQGTLKIEVAGNTSVYSYTLTPEGSSYKLETKYESGVSTEQNGTFDFVFSFNEAFRICITHTQGLGTSGLKETIIIVPQAAEQA